MIEENVKIPHKAGQVVKNVRMPESTDKFHLLTIIQLSSIRQSSLAPNV